MQLATLDSQLPTDKGSETETARWGAAWEYKG